MGDPLRLQDLRHRAQGVFGDRATLSVQTHLRVEITVEGDAGDSLEQMRELEEWWSEQTPDLVYNQITLSFRFKEDG